MKIKTKSKNIYEMNRYTIQYMYIHIDRTEIETKTK